MLVPNQDVIVVPKETIRVARKAFPKGNVYMRMRDELGLELTDAGFDYSVLSKFRERVIEGSQEHRLLDDTLQKFKDKGWLKARGRQRTDSTHVLSAARKLNR